VGTASRSHYKKDQNQGKYSGTELGTYEVTIEAEVEISVLVNDLDRFQNMIKWQKNPRISIILEEGIQKESLAAGKKTANLLTEKLKKNGFKVFRNTGGGELQMGLLVAVSLELSTRQTSYQGMELTLNEVSLSTNIYRPGDGEILASSSAVKSMPGENRLQILDRGSRSCVDAIWKDLREKLLRLWEKELYSERDIYLILKPLPSIARAHEITAIFKSDVSGILDAEVLTFQNGIGEYSLKYRGWPESLLNET